MTMANQGEFEALRLDLDGDWTVAQMAHLLASVDRLYEIPVRAYGDGELGSLGGTLRYVDAFNMSGEPLFIREELRLRLLRVRHESPGFVDLLGLGKVLEQVRLFTEKLIDLREQRRRESLEREYLEAQIEQVKTENLRQTMRALSEAKELELRNSEIRHLILDVDRQQEHLARLIEEEKITAIGAPPEDMAGSEPAGELTH
jgi:hypothetical protein